MTDRHRPCRRRSTVAARRPYLAAGVLAVALAAAACGGPQPEPERVSEDLRSQAERIAREAILVDTHVDVPYRLQEEWEDVSERTEDGDFDYPRARQGGLDAPFMSIYVPASYEDDGAKALADELIDMVEGLASGHPGKFAVATSPEQLRTVVAGDRIALPMGMENGAPIEGDLTNLQHFYDRGIRYITLTHSKNNHICDSSYDSEKQWGGLSPFGRQVVAEMNRLGVMIDVSHVSDDTFYQVMELTRAPVIASHSSCRKFTPGFERNMSDEMIRKLADNGGVIQINFGSMFLREDAQKASTKMWTVMQSFMDEHGLTSSDPQVEEFRDSYKRDNPPIFADLSDVADHIDHAVSLAGIDHVGLGSDFDGVGDSLPSGLKDVSQYPNLVYELLRRGYSEDDVRKILGENLLRVWTRVEQVAAEG